jgi:putative transposase
MLAHGDFGEQVLASVYEYVSAGRHLGQAARRLHLHVNSLRHRLERFQEITAANLDNPDVIVELCWAFEALKLDEGGDAPQPGRDPGHRFDGRP